MPKIETESGSITAVNNNSEIPFEVRRVYYLYDIPGGADRGGHAHKELYQMITAGSGSFDVVLDDGKMKRVVHLNRPYNALLVVPGIWRELVNFSAGSICLVLASAIYSEHDYLRDHSEFLEMKMHYHKNSYRNDH